MCYRPGSVHQDPEKDHAVVFIHFVSISHFNHAHPRCNVSVDENPSEQSAVPSPVTWHEDLVSIRPVFVSAHSCAYLPLARCK